jgi:putative cardiolipin synthase
LIDEKPTEEDYLKGRDLLGRNIADQSASEYAVHLANSDLANDIRNKNVRFSFADSSVYADPPEKLMVDTGKKSYQMLPDLIPYMAAAKEELIILSPYFVPGSEGTEFLVKLQERGVRVRILTNSLSSTDVSVVHAGYARYRKDLLRGGVELHELNKETKEEDRKAFKQGEIGVSKTSLHAKAFVVDRQHAFIGSLNLDARSVVQNTEIGVVIKSKELSEAIANGFDSKIDRAAFKLGLGTDEAGIEHTTWTGYIDGDVKTLTTEPYTSFWQRFVVSILRLMPIESQI